MIDEAALDAALPIVDPHHHLWDRPGSRYLFEAFVSDVRTGHNVIGSVFVEASSRQHTTVGTMYRADGPDELKSIGEIEFAGGAAAMARSGGYGPTGLCAGMVSYVDLRLGSRAEPVLERHAGFSRVRGIRNMTAWHADPAIANPELATQPGMLLDSRFREGFALLDRFGFSFDAWVFAPQLAELTDLARLFPNTTIVLDHLGSVMGAGAYAGRRATAMAEWRAEMAELARCPNVSVKIGGLAAPRGGFDLTDRPVPAGSAELARLWQPYVETCIELFGARRCMFESNFPVEKRWVPYVTLWNAFKRLTAACSAAERDALFWGTATDAYRLELPPQTSVPAEGFRTVTG